MYARTHAINNEQMENVWSLYKKHPIVGICTRAIKGAILGERITGLEKYKTDLHLPLYALATDAMAWIFCIGLVPVVLNRGGAGGGLSVHVPDAKSINIHVNTDALGKKTFTASFKHDNVLFGGIGGSKTKILVWSKCPDVPDSDGMLTTAITRLESSQRFSKFLHERVMVAEMLKSNPYHVTQAKATQNNDTDGVMWNVGDDVVEAAERSRMDGIESTQRHQYTTHTDNWGEMVTGTDGEMSKLLQDGCRPREYYLSAEREMVRPQPVISAVSELRDVARAADERVYNIFGVPMSMFTNATSTISGGANHLHEYIFNSTVLSHKNCVENLLNDVANLMGQSFDMLEATDIANATSALDELADNGKLKLHARPCIPLPQIDSLLQNGLLTQTDAMEMVRSFLMLPETTEIPELQGPPKRAKSTPVPSTENQ